ncbi:NAD(P)H dehydrogenase (quinone) [compost metagenome]
MLIMGLPYSEKGLMTTASGGTPYGPSHHAYADNRGPVTEDESALALAMGRRLARVALRLDGAGA